MKNTLEYIKNIYKNDPKVYQLFENCLNNTIQTTLKKIDDDYTFVITGDIDAMWLRDSSAQIKPFLKWAKSDLELKNLIKGVINIQKKLILIDPYANAFNIAPNNNGHHDDLTEMTPWTFERKFEIDSLCYPVQLAYLYFFNTDDSSIFDETFYKMLEQIILLFKTETRHEELSKYRFIRTNPDIMKDIDRHKYETLPRNGKGNPTTYTGLIWSGFRPSDDACQFGYLIPSNMFAFVILGYMKELITRFYKNQSLIKDIDLLRKNIQNGINKHAIINTKYGDVFAYEVDGLGNYLLMDDANVPSLLSTPYIGYLDESDATYQNTRKLILSEDNPFFYSGKYARGIGSPHTPENHIWHISLAIEGLTTSNIEAKKRILEIFKTTDANCNLMHEGFDVNNPNVFSRKWFSWANSLFVEFILSLTKEDA